MKRILPAQGTEKKKPRLGDMDLDELNANVQIDLPPLADPPEGVNPMANFVDDTKALQTAEIECIRKLLASAYKVAALAMKNPNIYAIVDDWSNVVYGDPPDDQSLVEMLHMDSGWTEETLLQFLGESPTPFVIPPLSRLQSRVVWACIRYIVSMKELRDAAKFAISLPEDWLGIKLKFKEFGKKGWRSF